MTLDPSSTNRSDYKITDDTVLALADRIPRHGEWPVSLKHDCVRFAVDRLGWKPGRTRVLANGNLYSQLDCYRCNGRGVWGNHGTCFLCGGAKWKDVSRKTIPAIKKEVERIENERAGRGRFTNAELRKHAAQRAAADQLVADRRNNCTAAGLDYDRILAAFDLWEKYCRSHGRQVNIGTEIVWDHNEANPDFDKEIKRLADARGYQIASDIFYRSERGLSAAQAAVIDRWVVRMEEAPEAAAEARRKAEAIVIEEGRYDFEGEVFWAGTSDGPYGTTSKIGVRLESGAALFGTNNIHAERGDRVRITATVSASQNKPGTGNFKRPKGQVIHIAG